MRLWNFLWNFLLDFIFPPTKSALELRAISPITLFARLPPSPSPPHPFITSLFAYKNPLVSELIWSIKYKKDRHAIECGGYVLYKKLAEIYLNETCSEKIILIPIPISKERRKERGYNQCELLICEVMKLDTENRFAENFDLLARTKHTEGQTLKNRKDRLESAENIFDIRKNLQNKNLPIVIIDDVTTTGSTLKEAREALLRARYTDVRALTLAH